ncbi:decapping endonuclease targeting mRNA [Coemansia sp. S16]|nr:decapping endonuclease targeting mRNA [Coemansia sp. S3946]KAJ2044687.1 decapping endonuclease targeting mRNA [Coemansia sp. S16]KAJ2067607.1 decapping endonuclease targeting mRNA [Coemansia sp. S155-1]KAJ2348584.1 decapping endonuclease targeting mRNA [Coemansia sp. RSA 2673]
MSIAQSQAATQMHAAVRRLSLHPLSKYRLPCPRFSEPLELLSFSYDGQRKVCFDNRELKYFHPPSLNPAPCLFDGIESQIQRDHDKNEHIDGLLAALAHLPAPRGRQPDFVMYRGMLTRIFVTPYSTRDSWAMNATKVGNTIYVEDASKSVEDREDRTEFHLKMMYSGYRFETMCVLDKPPQQLKRDGQLDSALLSRANSVVDTNREYCSVFKTRLGNHSIISGAEVDCIDQEKPSTAPNRVYRELKTSGILDNHRKVESFERHKLLKFWAQSFIAGIPMVTVGFRDNDGILRSVEDFRTQDIPRLVKHNQSMWQPNVCMNFADQVLQFIKDCVVDEGPEVQFRIAFDSGSQEIQISALGRLEPFLTREYLALVAQPL